jgi:hypothetical protein
VWTNANDALANNNNYGNLNPRELTTKTNAEK